jgi:energy coupling factor transporter S component ThiW
MKATKITTSSVLTAFGVIFSFWPGPIPLGPTLVFPFQSIINVIAGILLGPWYAAAVATCVGLIRIGLHTGTIFSLPGGIPGAILVGVTYRLTKSNLSAFAEILGTAVVGAFLSAFLVTPVIGKTATLLFFIIVFTPPAVLGSVIGFIVITALNRRGVIGRIPL